MKAAGSFETLVNIYRIDGVTSLKRVTWKERKAFAELGPLEKASLDHWTGDL
jgi:hypothetical protein